MDDSSDFQDTKKSVNGPKPVVKKTVKPKKAPKKIKGQKDIRKILKTKTELESYSKDFDKVCKKAGIDVDSEQLQLAIALSKSLQTKESTSEGEGSQSKTSQDRVGKIRSTLLEYGFKVPEIKITGSKKLKNYRKKYKLLQTSESEKQQIIANKYSQILLEDITNQPFCEYIDNSNKQLYYFATNASYEALKNNSIFYIDLVEQSCHTGNQLRDWSEIPGRPVSPKTVEPIIMNFCEIACSQEEVDNILSGSVKSCQNIVKKKSNFTHIVDNHGKIDLLDKMATITSVEGDKQLGLSTSPKCPQKALENKDDIKIIDPICTTTYRSCSPDIFDDEFSIVDNSKNSLSPKEQDCEENNHVDSSNKSIDLTDCLPRSIEATLPVSSKYTNLTKIVTKDFMEITECVEMKHLNNVNSKLSQKNETKRKSDDFMEITNCVVTTAKVDCDVDLTQIFEENETPGQSNNEISYIIPSKFYEKLIPSSSAARNIKESHIDLTQNDNITRDRDSKITDLDLTQSSTSSDDLPAVLLSNSRMNSADNTILIDPKEYEKIQNKSCIDILDISDGVECINPPNGSFFEEFVHNHSDNNDGSYEKLEDQIDLTQNSYININLEDDVDLTQKSDNSNKSIRHNTSILNYESKENKHNNSTDSFPDNVDLTQDNKKSNVSKEVLDVDDIDLTQNSDSKNESPQKSLQTNDGMLEDNQHEINEYVTKSSQRYSSLGKKDNVSIDYDEMSEHFKDKSLNSPILNDSFDDDNINDVKVDLEVVNDFDVNYYCSQNSEVFQISDKELDYSLTKSKLEKTVENFQVGRISSILEDLSKVGSYRKSVTKTAGNESIIIADYGSDHEEIPNECITYTNNEISPIRHKRINEISTPKNAGTSGTLVETPNNSQYVIKTNNVTPMPHYEFMSTPEIHKELDKYGIKPFKRKRAIQLLSHIYNQTHPVIEYSDDARSPAKKPRINRSPKKRLTPKKLITSPKASQSNQADPISLETNELQNKEVVYEVTNDPVLREVECHQEDWVFQKREKAKVQSCRVPLHIAFHNYVSSRQSLHEAILCYQPINIDVIHKDLVGYGHRYDPKDLLKFLDKKCITVKTTDNDSRNNKRH